MVHFSWSNFASKNLCYVLSSFKVVCWYIIRCYAHWLFLPSCSLPTLLLSVPFSRFDCFQISLLLSLSLHIPLSFSAHSLRLQLQLPPSVLTTLVFIIVLILVQSLYSKIRIPFESAGLRPLCSLPLLSARPPSLPTVLLC